MFVRVIFVICVLRVAGSAAESRRWFAREVGCWITQEKVPASWEDAQRRCEKDGADLASPLNMQLFNYMQSLINVQNHSAAYFIGTRVSRSDSGQEVYYESVEGRRLAEMPWAVFSAIDQLDLEQGDCLSMDRHGIRAVSCWDHLPYICYSNETMECGSVLATTQTPHTSEATTTTTAPTTTTIAPTTTTVAPTTTTIPPTTTTIPLTTTTIPPTTTTIATTTTTIAPTTTTIAPTTTIAATTPRKAIPPGYKYQSATGSYYKFYKTIVSWDVAKAKCASEGAHLVVLNNAEEAKIVNGIMREVIIADGLWIGLRDNRPGGVSDWRTINGEPINEVYHAWRDYHPYTQVGYPCGVYSTYNHDLVDWTCDGTFYVTCEISQ